MKRVLRALLISVVSVCLAGTVAVFVGYVVFQPREEILPPLIEDGTELRSRIQVTRRWSLEPPESWWYFGSNGAAACGRYHQNLGESWHYGPFSFVEERERDSWPIAVEKAARLALAKKLWADKASLSFQIKNDGWHVSAHGPQNESWTMTFTEEGKSVREDIRRSP